jgi:hypothetical protein
MSPHLTKRAPERGGEHKLARLEERQEQPSWQASHGLKDEPGPDSDIGRAANAHPLPLPECYSWPTRCFLRVADKRWREFITLRRGGVAAREAMENE